MLLLSWGFQEERTYRASTTTTTMLNTLLNGEAEINTDSREIDPVLVVVKKKDHKLRSSDRRGKDRTRQDNYKTEHELSRNNRPAISSHLVSRLARRWRYRQSGAGSIPIMFMFMLCLVLSSMLSVAKFENVFFNYCKHDSIRSPSILLEILRSGSYFASAFYVSIPALWLSGKALAQRSGGAWFDPRPSQTKDFKIGISNS
ncbi:hypothetical protein ElyMa_005466700 [Elysia marginata]|uniref:Uncharacterized protein n=1 Tax=Elysia marginata TaxID=1093978 RepID=A0AAV4EQ51_9GAST|nr:hypothetical protein ElyMa_005466700 [Elysia marginata]